MRKIFSLIAAVLFAGSMMATTVTKTVADLATEHSFTNSEVCTPFDLDEVIAVSTEATDANTGKYYSNGEQIRLYQTGAAKLILTAADGYKISSVTLEYASQNTGILVEAASGEAVAFENVQSATFTVGNSGSATNGQARITSFSVTYAADGEVPPVEPTMDYYVAGSMTNWAPMAAYKLAANPANEGEYMGEFTFAANDEFKVGYSDGTTIESTNYFPNGIDNNYVITEAGDYTVYFRPDGQGGDDWHYGYINAIKKEALADPTNCAEAAEAALSVSANNELYNNGAVYTIEGYVTAIQTAYSATNHNITFWMADAADGGNVLEAYRAACASEEDAPAVGDKVAVTGKLTKYNTTPEFAAGCTFVITEKSAPAVNLGEKTIAEFLELKNFKDTCILTGVVTSIANTTYGNLYLADETDTVYVYGVLTPAGESKKFADLGVEAGDTLTVLAIYNEYQGAPQVTNAIFVSVAKVPVIVEDIEITLNTGLQWTDVVADEGWWQMMGYNDTYMFSLSNIETTETAGVYTIADLDPGYSYVEEIATQTEIGFVDGSITVAVAADSTVTITGTLVGEDGNNYIFNLTYKDPVAETTVDVQIAEWELIDVYLAHGLFGLSGEAADGTYVQLALWTEADIAGDYTGDDLDFQNIGSGIIDANEAQQSIFSATIHIEEAGEAYVVTADLLCYNNTLYHVTTVAMDIETINALRKAFKSIKNGQVVIEKAGKTYNMNGAVIR